MGETCVYTVHPLNITYALYMRDGYQLAGAVSSRRCSIKWQVHIRCCLCIDADMNDADMNDADMNDADMKDAWRT